MSADVKQATSQIPGEDVLVLESGQEPHLVGTRCSACGEVMFGPRNMCLNCGSGAVAGIRLAAKGRIYASTVIRHPPPECEIPVPYGLGHVELPEGVLVPALFTESDMVLIQPGTPVEMVIVPFKQDEHGNEVVTYRFRPIPE